LGNVNVQGVDGASNKRDGYSAAAISCYHFLDPHCTDYIARVHVIRTRYST
jgi:hypothetical protein